MPSVLPCRHRGFLPAAPVFLPGLPWRKPGLPLRQLPASWWWKPVHLFDVSDFRWRRSYLRSVFRSGPSSGPYVHWNHRSDRFWSDGACWWRSRYLLFPYWKQQLPFLLLSESASAWLSWSVQSCRRFPFHASGWFPYGKRFSFHKPLPCHRSLNAGRWSRSFPFHVHHQETASYLRIRCCCLPSASGRSRSACSCRRCRSWPGRSVLQSIRSWRHILFLRLESHHHSSGWYCARLRRWPSWHPRSSASRKWFFLHKNDWVRRSLLPKPWSLLRPWRHLPGIDRHGFWNGYSKIPDGRKAVLLPWTGYNWGLPVRFCAFLWRWRSLRRSCRDTHRNRLSVADRVPPRVPSMRHIWRCGYCLKDEAVYPERRKLKYTLLSLPHHLPAVLYSCVRFRHCALRFPECFFLFLLRIFWKESRSHGCDPAVPDRAFSVFRSFRPEGLWSRRCRNWVFPSKQRSFLLPHGGLPLLSVPADPKAAKRQPRVSGVYHLKGFPEKQVPLPLLPLSSKVFHSDGRLLHCFSPAAYRVLIWFLPSGRWKILLPLSFCFEVLLDVFQYLLSSFQRRLHLPCFPYQGVLFSLSSMPWSWREYRHFASHGVPWDLPVSFPVFLIPWRSSCSFFPGPDKKLPASDSGLPAFLHIGHPLFRSADPVHRSADSASRFRSFFLLSDFRALRYSVKDRIDYPRSFSRQKNSLETSKFILYKNYIKDGPKIKRNENFYCCIFKT